MKILNLVEEVVIVPTLYNYEKVVRYDTYSIGDGLWCIEAIGKNESLVKTWIGSNGTRRPADNLWNDVEAWGSKVAIPEHKKRIVVAPDGYAATYKALEHEVLRGRLHGCVITF